MFNSKKKLLLIIFCLIAVINSYSDENKYKKAKEAILTGNVEKLLYYFENGLSPYTRSNIEQKNIFQLALETKNIEILELFLFQEVDINRWSRNGVTPLYYATKINNKDMINLFLKHGANPLIKNDEYEENNYFDSISFLVEKSIKEKNNIFLKICLEKGYDPNYIYSVVSLDTPLIISIKQSNFDAMKMLIENGSDLTTVNMLNNYMTPLSIAIKKHGEQSNYVKYLKEKNAFNKIYKFPTPSDGYSTTDRLRIRNKPTLNAEIVGHLMKGDNVEMIEATPLAYEIDGMLYPWIKIKFSNITGWVFGGYIDFDKGENQGF